MTFATCKLLLITLSLVELYSPVFAKTDCEGCRDLVQGILKGLDKSKRKNFGGGDVNWEEKNLGKYSTSETRLIEVLEEACGKDNFQCNKMLEEHEDDVTYWYKNLQSDEALLDYVCIKKAEVCCPDDKFGENCTDCPRSESKKICFGRGTCEGSGDKKGSGKCVCDEGYTGDLCDTCAERHFETFSNDTYIQCALCHATCQTCSGGNATECKSCRPGYREEHDTEDEKSIKCVDVNECVEQRDLCPVGEYCANTEGSYKCEDIDECASGAVCLGMYEVCVNTIGHYKCECARFFRRDSVTGQCQPDPAIYSRYAPNRKPAPKEEEKKEGWDRPVEADGDGKRNELETHDAKANHASGVSNGRCSASNDEACATEEDSLTRDDVINLTVTVVICLIGTAAAKGSLVWGILFFACLGLTAMWWASDKTEQIVNAVAKSRSRVSHEL